MNFTEYGYKPRSQCPPCEWNFTQPYQMSFAIRTLMQRVMTEVMRHFAPADVYWVPGNHDGPEDSTFAHEAVMPESVAWARVLVEAGVVVRAHPSLLPFDCFLSIVSIRLFPLFLLPFL